MRDKGNYIFIHPVYFIYAQRLYGSFQCAFEFLRIGIAFSSNSGLFLKCLDLMFQCTTNLTFPLHFWIAFHTFSNEIKTIHDFHMLLAPSKVSHRALVIHQHKHDLCSTNTKYMYTKLDWFPTLERVALVYVIFLSATFFGLKLFGHSYQLVNFLLDAKAIKTFVQRIIVVLSTPVRQYFSWSIDRF